MGMDYQAVYSDLRNRIGKLTRAAIDAYVRDEEDGFGVVFERNEKEYSISSGSAGASMEKKISRPNARGEGGGSVTCTMTNVAGSREMQGKVTGISSKTFVTESIASSIRGSICPIPEILTMRSVNAAR